MQCECRREGTALSLPVYTPGPAAPPAGVLSPPRCRSWGCSRSRYHSRCWARSQRKRMMMKRMKRSALLTCPSHLPGTWEGTPPRAHLASWQTGIQTHPGEIGTVSTHYNSQNSQRSQKMKSKSLKVGEDYYHPSKGYKVQVFIWK